MEKFEYNMGTTGRDFKQYQEFLFIPEDFLKGKSILDVGGGLSNFTAIVNRKFSNQGTKAFAIDLNYDLLPDENFGQKIRERGGWLEVRSEQENSEIDKRIEDNSYNAIVDDIFERKR